ncbi:MAG: hypothetical protein KIT84_39115 [Labilithrix sp.]|nr:hypothetical protein [Labilithrix sp.]MCW5817073.1 hypothetical protein [Labilithrix sp.]
MKTVRSASVGLVLLTMGGILMIPHAAFADCTPMAMTLTDSAVFAVHGCDVRFPQWNAKEFNIEEEEWRTRGYHAACNTTLEYAKHWNAVYLIWRGNMFGRPTFGPQAFHDPERDYLEAARALDRGGRWHDKFEHRMKDVLPGRDAESRFTYRPFAVNLVTSACVLYSGVGSYGVHSVTNRAANFVHESWHAWQDINGINARHNTKGVDGYFYHPKAQYSGGDLWQEKNGHRNSHSVFQVQVEFLCDTADNPGPFTPFVARVSAQIYATSLATSRLLSATRTPEDGLVRLGTGPAYTCGSPDLLGEPVTPPPPPPASTCNSCTIDVECIGFCRDRRLEDGGLIRCCDDEGPR